MNSDPAKSNAFLSPLRIEQRHFNNFSFHCIKLFLLTNKRQKTEVRWISSKVKKTNALQDPPFFLSVSPLRIGSLQLANLYFIKLVNCSFSAKKTAISFKVIHKSKVELFSLLNLQRRLAMRLLLFGILVVPSSVCFLLLCEMKL